MADVEPSAEVAEEAGHEEPTNAETPKPANRVARITKITLGVCLLFFVWYLVADRITPSSNQGRVRGRIVPVVPEVSGVIQDVLVQSNEIVIGGQPLLQINASDYELAVRQAEANLELAGQDVGAQTAGVAAAQAQLSNAQVILENVEVDAARIFSLGEQQLIPQADVEHARTRLDEARGDVATAEAELTRARQQLGPEGEANPRVQAALVALENARLDLARTTVYSPTTGVIANLRVSAGYYANAGQPLLTFVSGEDVWIEAYMRENSIANIEAGDPVEIALDVAPGRVFDGEVDSVGYGIDTGADADVGVLPTISPAAGWLRAPQRFPVTVRFTDESSRGLRREGGQADIVVYTGNNWLFNALAWISIRVKAYFSYIY